MSINAFIAVHPDIDPQFDDADIMGQLPFTTQQAIEEARAAGKGFFKTLQHNSRGYFVYNVYGSPDDLQAAIVKFGADNIIPLGSWNTDDGERYGTRRVRSFVMGALPASVIIPASDVSPSTYEIKRYVNKDVIMDINGEMISVYQRVLETEVRGLGGLVDISYNGSVVERVPVSLLNQDGSYTFQPEPPTTLVETIEGTPSIPLHPALLAIMPDDVTYDPDGVELNRTPATSLKQVVLRAGQAHRRFE